MPYSPRLILHAPPWDSPELEKFAEKCIRDKVVAVCVIGDDCERVEDVIDELIVGDASDSERFLNTTSHPNEIIAEVRRFAEAWTLDVDPTGPVQEIGLQIRAENGDWVAGRRNRWSKDPGLRREIG